MDYYSNIISYNFAEVLSYIHNFILVGMNIANDFSSPKTYLDNETYQIYITIFYIVQQKYFKIIILTIPVIKH